MSDQPSPLVPELLGIPEDDTAEPGDAEPGPDGSAVPEDLRG